MVRQSVVAGIMRVEKSNTLTNLVGPLPKWVPYSREQKFLGQLSWDYLDVF